MAGCLIYFILSDGHIPHESTYPYINEPEGVIHNVKSGKFRLDHLPSAACKFASLIANMVSPSEQLRPTIDECLLRFQGNQYFHNATYRIYLHLPFMCMWAIPR